MPQFPKQWLLTQQSPPQLLRPWTPLRLKLSPVSSCLLLRLFLLLLFLLLVHTSYRSFSELLWLASVGRPLTHSLSQSLPFHIHIHTACVRPLNPNYPAFCFWLSQECVCLPRRPHLFFFWLCPDPFPPTFAFLLEKKSPPISNAHRLLER